MAAKTVDAMVNVEPYNAIAEAEGLATTLVDYYEFDKMPVFMAATPEFVEQHPDAWSPTESVARRRERFQEQTRQGRRHDLFVLHVEGLQDVEGHIRQGAGARRCASRLAGRSRSLHDSSMPRYWSRTKKIKAMPDWKKAFAQDLLKKAMA